MSSADLFVDDRPPPAALLDAIRWGLAAIPEEGAARLASFEQAWTGGNEAGARELAAAELSRACADWTRRHGDLLQRWIRRRFRTIRRLMDPEDLAGLVLIGLDDVIRRWQSAEGDWNAASFKPGKEKWFPVRPGMPFEKWVWNNAVKTSGQAVKRAVEALQEIPSEADWSWKAQADRDTETPWSFDPYREAVRKALNEDLTVSSPDLAGRREGAAAARQRTVRAAALVASDRLFDFLDEIEGSIDSPRRACSDAVRQTEPAEPGSKRDQLVRRLVPDVLFAVTAALDIAIEHLLGDEGIAEEVHVAVQITRDLWRFAQLQPIADLLHFSATQEVGRSRARGQVAWARDLSSEVDRPALGRIALALARQSVTATVEFLTEIRQRNRHAVEVSKLDDARRIADQLQPNLEPDWGGPAPTAQVAAAALVALADRLTHFLDRAGHAGGTQEMT